MPRGDRVLIVLLRLIGFTALLAVIAVVMPTSWMAALHDSMGIGSFPETPIVGYLARSLSAFYAVFGGLLVYVSFDLERCRPLIRFLGLTLLAMNVALLGIDLAAGMPWWWTIGEGPPGAAVSVWIWWLAREQNNPSSP